MKLKTNDVPRDVSIDRIIKYIGLIHGKYSEKTHKAKPGTEHNARQVAIFLGFLDWRGRLTASGNALVGLPDTKTKLARMAIGFENTKCVQGWMEWCELDSIFRLKPYSAKPFLFANSKLKEGRKQAGVRVLKRFLKSF